MSRLIKQAFGDGGRLIVQMRKYRTHKRIWIIVSDNKGKIFEKKSFNKRKNAEKKFKKVVEEF